MNNKTKRNTIQLYAYLMGSIILATEERQPPTMFRLNTVSVIRIFFITAVTKS